MHTKHRVEVLHKETNDKFVAWCNDSGSVLVLKRHGESHWQAVVEPKGMTPYAGRGAAIQGPVVGAETLMVSPTLHGIVNKLAMDNGMHLVFTPSE